MPGKTGTVYNTVVIHLNLMEAIILFALNCMNLQIFKLKVIHQLLKIAVHLIKITVPSGQRELNKLKVLFYFGAKGGI